MALSVKQPYAEAIANGSKRIEYRTWRSLALVDRDLLIVASRTPGDGYRAEPIGVAICVVRVKTIAGRRGDYEWHLTGPRRVAPFAVRGYAALYKVPDESIVFVLPCPGDRIARLRRAKLDAVQG